MNKILENEKTEMFELKHNSAEMSNYVYDRLVYKSLNTDEPFNDIPEVEYLLDSSVKQLSNYIEKNKDELFTQIMRFGKEDPNRMYSEVLQYINDIVYKDVLKDIKEKFSELVKTEKEKEYMLKAINQFNDTYKRLDEACKEFGLEKNRCLNIGVTVEEQINMVKNNPQYTEKQKMLALLELEKLEIAKEKSEDVLYDFMNSHRNVDTAFNDIKMKNELDFDKKFNTKKRKKVKKEKEPMFVNIFSMN